MLGLVQRRAKRELPCLKRATALCAGCFFCNGISTVLNENEPILKLLRYSILLIALLLMAARWRGTLRAFAKGGLLWVFIGMMFVSLAWSISPSYTMDSLRGEVLPMTAFALYFASRFNIREQMQMVAITLGIGALLSLFYAIAIPSIGRHIGGQFDGAWKGIYAQKNNFSTTMTLTMLVFFCPQLSQPRSQRAPTRHRRPALFDRANYSFHLQVRSHCLHHHANCGAHLSDVSLARSS